MSLFSMFSNDLGVDLGTSNVLIYADGKGLVVREPSVVAVDKNTGKILQVGAAMFSNDLGVDLGTSNVLIYADGKGLVVREPSVVAVDKNTGKILQVGAAARNMLGRTPGNVVAMHPLKDGIVSDHEMTVRMLQEMFKTATKAGLTVRMLQEMFKTATKAGLFTPKPRVVVSVPSGVSEVEERRPCGCFRRCSRPLPKPVCSPRSPVSSSPFPPACPKWRSAVSSTPPLKPVPAVCS